MIYRSIPSLKNSASAICLGTAQFGSQLDEKTSFTLLDRYVEMGGNFLDSAHVYGAWDTAGVNGGCGNSELVIGRWLSRGADRRGADRRGVDRRSVIIGTKGGHPDFDTKAGGLTRSILHQHLQESLDRLGTDYIDIYWLHRDDRTVPVEEILSWLEEPCRQGVIRSIGCSHWRTDRLRDASALADQTDLPVIRASQIAWSLADAKAARTDGPYGEQLAMDSDTWDFHRTTGLPLVAYSSQARGFFAGASPKPQVAEAYGSAVNWDRRHVAFELAKQKSCTPNQIALAWLLRQPFPTFGLVGPRTVEQLEDSMGAPEISLREEEWLELKNPTGGR